MVRNRLLRWCDCFQNSAWHAQINILLLDYVAGLETQANVKAAKAVVDLLSLDRKQKGKVKNKNEEKKNGKGKDEKVHWVDTPSHYVRHYKFQEQLHETDPKRYIDGIELIQYSIMNAPEADSASDREKQDWITFFKRGHRMNESQVKDQIQTPEVLQAFERAKFSSMPGDVKKAYDDEDRQYDQYSQHTAEIASKGKAEGIAEGEKKGLLKAALGMKRMNIPTAQIVEATGLSAAEVEEIRVDD